MTPDWTPISKRKPVESISILRYPDRYFIYMGSKLRKEKLPSLPKIVYYKIYISQFQVMIQLSKEKIEDFNKSLDYLFYIPRKVIDPYWVGARNKKYIEAEVKKGNIHFDLRKLG